MGGGATVTIDVTPQRNVDEVDERPTPVQVIYN
jgi:hypothetical protein